MGKESEDLLLTVSGCRPGEWVRLSTGWWRLGVPLAGGIGARPLSRVAGWKEDLGQRFPVILEPTEPVLERRVIESSGVASA